MFNYAQGTRRIRTFLTKKFEGGNPQLGNTVYTFEP